jgi:hypothetical protein
VPVTEAVPRATPVNVTEQLPDTRTQLAPTVPTGVSDETKLTAPVGVFAAFVISVTVAAQIEVPPMLIEAGLQNTAVDVLSIATVIVLDVPELLLKFESPEYVPVTAALPEETPVKLTEQLAAPGVSVGNSVQLVPTVPTAVFDDVKLTVPVGVFDETVLVTLTVQVDIWPMLTVAGAQLTPMATERSMTVIVLDVPELSPKEMPPL